MTEAEIMRLCELPAGRELDEAVATHVRGWKQLKDRAWRDAKGKWIAFLPPFSTDMAAAAIVLDHAVVAGCDPFMGHGHIEGHGRGWLATMGTEYNRHDAHADTLPLAICRAALKAALYGKE